MPQLFFFSLFDAQVKILYSVTFHLRNFKMGSEILDTWSQILMNVVNIHHNQNKTGYFSLSDLLRSKSALSLRRMSHWSAVTDRGKYILKYWVCSFEFLDPFYLLFVMFFYFRLAGSSLLLWTSPLASTQLRRMKEKEAIGEGWKRGEE